MTRMTKLSETNPHAEEACDTLQMAGADYAAVHAAAVVAGLLAIAYELRELRAEVKASSQDICRALGMVPGDR